MVEDATLGQRIDIWEPLRSSLVPICRRTGTKACYSSAGVAVGDGLASAGVTLRAKHTDLQIIALANINH